MRTHPPPPRFRGKTTPRTLARIRADHQAIARQIECSIVLTEDERLILRAWKPLAEAAELAEGGDP